MSKGYYWIIGIVVIIVILVFIFLGNLSNDAKPSIYQIPWVTVEGTVLSISYGEFDEPECIFCPDDYALIRIDNVDRTNDPDNRVIVGEGEEINFTFRYTTRPAIVEYDVFGKEERIGDLIYYEAGELYREIVDDTYVYHVGGNPNSEIPDRILPGVNEGDKIRILQYFGSDSPIIGSRVIGIYEIL